jgi:hypothetical protein
VIPAVGAPTRANQNRPTRTKVSLPERQATTAEVKGRRAAKAPLVTTG